MLLLLGIGTAFPIVASAQTEVVVTKQRVTGCTIIEIYEDGELKSEAIYNSDGERIL